VAGLVRGEESGLENFRLRVFRAVAEEMSFRKAAEVLHLSQPAVSQHVRALEEETGVQLFDRGRGAGNGSQISLTEAGRVLLGYANTAAETMVEARRALAALHEEAEGPLKLGASTTVAQYVLPRILGAFLKQYPQVKISMVSGNTERVVEAVAEKKIAMGVIEGPAMRREMKTERMVRDEMVLIASPNHPWASKRAGAVALSDLARMPLLVRERGSGSRRVVERALKGAGLPLRSLQVAMELDSTEAILSGVEAELGVGFVSRWALGKSLRLGTVRVIPVKGLQVVRDFSFVWLAGTEMAGAAAAFQRFARAMVETFDAGDK
jgi:DNA-binding transcriptional LysR family regulator